LVIAARHEVQFSAGQYAENNASFCAKLLPRRQPIKLTSDKIAWPKLSLFVNTLANLRSGKAIFEAQRLRLELFSHSAQGSIASPSYTLTDGELCWIIANYTTFFRLLQQPRELSYQAVRGKTGCAKMILVD